MYQNILFDRVKNLIESYDFSKPFSLYLKELFQANPKMGARDRRETRDLCYHFLRLGNNLPNENFLSKLAVGTFLCSNQLSANFEILIEKNSKLPHNDVSRNLEEKIEIVRLQYPEFSVDKIFCDKELLNEEFVSDDFYKSFLLQPRVWIRIRNNFVEKVIEELNSENIQFERVENDCTLSFSPMQKLENLQSYISGLFEIQDVNSQKIAEFLSPKKNDVWLDACAASGGKSLALIDKEPDIYLLATDLRENILKNYSKRMRKVGFEGYKTQTIDLFKKMLDPSDKFDGILADVPCTGSGTWARSPENLLKSHSEIVRITFQPLQRKIISNLIGNLREGGQLIYSTCSVFKSENEDNVEFFLKKLPLKLIKTQTLKGFEIKADSLFVASFQKVSV